MKPFTVQPESWPTGLKVFWSLAGGGVILLWGMALAVRLHPKQGQLHDFSQDWCSARNYFEGQPIYLPLAESVPLYFHGDYRGGIKVNAHPPASVLLVLPFGRLEYGQALMLWNVLSLALLAPTVWLILRPTGLAFSPWTLIPIVSILLVSNTLAQQVNQGQWNLILLFLLTLAWYLIRNDQPVAGGAALGLATALKLFPGFLFLYLLVQRRWSAILAGVAAFAALTALSGFILGWESVREYATRVVPAVEKFHDFWPNASIAGFWSKLLDGPSGSVVPLVKNPSLAKAVTTVCSAVVVVLAAWKSWRAKSPAQRDVAFGTCVVGMMLISPVTWDHYFLMLVLPLAVFWRRLPPTIGYRTLVLAAVLLLIVVNAEYVWDRVIPGDGEVVLGAGMTPSVAQPWHTLTVISYPHYMLWVLLLAAVVKRGEDGTSSFHRAPLIESR